jgi:heptosyltransferase-1
MKALIVKTSSLGDIVHTFPVISYLKQKNAIIDWIVEKPFSSLPMAHPDVHQVISIESRMWRQNIFNGNTWKELASVKRTLKQRKYDVVFDLQGNIKSSIITWLTPSPHKVGFGKQTVSEWPNLLATNKKIDPPSRQNIRHDYLYLVQAFFDDFAEFQDLGVVLKVDDSQKRLVQDVLDSPNFTQGPKILVCPGSAWLNKTLPTPLLLEFLTRIQNALQCNYIIAWGNEEEKKIAYSLSRDLRNTLSAPHLTLPGLQSLMHSVDMVIAMDSLPLHLAGTTDTPTWAAFGPSSANKYNPSGIHHKAFQGTCPYHQSFEKRCSMLRTCTTGACLRHQKVDTLLENFHSWAKSILA